jgi:protein-disulfide isomerase
MPPKPRPNRPTPADKSRRPNLRLLIALVGGAVAVAVIAIVVSVTHGSGKGSSTTVTGNASFLNGVAEHGLVLGNPNATVTLTEYIDLTCPVCKEYTLTTFPSIVAHYVRPGKVKVEMQPVNNGWPSGARGRELALAAARQNGAFPFVELAYHNQGDEQSAWLTDDLANALAAKARGLNPDKLFADAKSSSVQSQAAAVEAQAQADGVRGTPTFVLTTPDGKRHMLGAGFYPFSAFATALDRALKA